MAFDPNNCPVDRRIMEREAERRAKRTQEVKRLEAQAVNSAAWDTWFEQRYYQELIKEDSPGRKLFTEIMGQVVYEIRKEYRPQIAQLEAKVKQLEQQSSLDARFYDLERRLADRQQARDESKLGSEMIPQSELLAKIEKLQRQVDDLKRVADLGASFRELAERVSELEKTNSLEARFTKLADETKRRPEIQQSELPARVEGLQRQLEDLKKIADKPGPQGPPGAPGKLAHVKEYAAGRVHYEADVVAHAGALWQARGDTVHAPPHVDWVCLARAGRNGCDGRSPNVCGTFDALGKYERLDIVALDGATFIARSDNPGVCPGDGWQLVASRGKTGDKGQPGPRGDKGERGEPGATVISWQLDRERYRVSPLMSDGKVGPMLELRGLFEQFLSETS